jgi:hypothetical protein
VRCAQVLNELEQPTVSLSMFRSEGRFGRSKETADTIKALWRVLARISAAAASADSAAAQATP